MSVRSLMTNGAAPIVTLSNPVASDDGFPVVYDATDQKLNVSTAPKCGTTLPESGDPAITLTLTGNTTTISYPIVTGTAVQMGDGNRLVTLQFPSAAGVGPFDTNALSLQGEISDTTLAPVTDMTFSVLLTTPTGVVPAVGLFQADGADKGKFTISSPAAATAVIHNLGFTITYLAQAKAP